MNLQPIIRAAVCAALVAVCCAGAGLFPTRPVAGQEAKQQTLRGAAALERLKQEGQYESLQTAMDQARFGVSRAEQTLLGRPAWHAPNPAAGYDAYVTEAGVNIAINDETYVSLSLRGIGYGEALQAVGPGEVSGDKQTINLRRYSGLREWYVNGRDGLEQGFTLIEPPGARGQGAPLRLALQVSEGWRAVASEDGKLVTLRGANAVVEYGKLVVRDGLGLNIQSRLTVAEGEVFIEAEDHDAAYPLTIDPLFTLQQKLAAADGAVSDSFGYAVALNGNTAVVSAPEDDVTYEDQGTVYVFTRNGATWTQQARLNASDGAEGDFFGHAVALSGDTLMVGATFDAIGANNSQGSVYVFVSPPCPDVALGPASLTDGVSGASYQQAVTVSGGMGTYQFAISGGVLPPGLTLARDGLLAGTPMTPGEYHFTISATNLSSLCAGSREYTITVTPQCPTITLNPASLPSARQGAAYNQTLTATGGATPFSFAAAAGALPPGLSLSAGGLLSGAPAQTGSYSFTARVTDANGCAATRDYTLVVSGSVAHASAASYDTGALAPDSIVAAFGANLATEPRAAQGLPLPIELAGSTVTVRDSQGGVRPAPLFYVSPNQINYLMPSGLANGAATVTIKNGQGAEVQSSIQISAVAPGLFSANAYGAGPASAFALRVRANGQQVYEPVARYDAQTQSFVLEPIDLSDAAEQVYLVLFGTGIRHRGALDDVTVEVGGTKLPVAYAGASPGLAGVDQVNVFLPASLRGRGEQTVTLRVNGKVSNGVNVRFQ